MGDKLGFIDYGQRGQPVPIQKISLVIRNGDIETTKSLLYELAEKKSESEIVKHFDIAQERINKHINITTQSNEYNPTECSYK